MVVEITDALFLLHMGSLRALSLQSTWSKGFDDGLALKWRFGGGGDVRR